MTSNNKGTGISSMYQNKPSTSSSSSTSILDKMMDNVTSNPLSSGGSSSNVNKTNSGWYVPSGTTTKVEEIEEEEINPLEEQYRQLQEAYKRQEELLREQNRLAVEQGVNRLNSQKESINQSADENARQAYIMHMQAQKALPQQLASQGITGGATETANLGLQSTYQNNVNAINQNKMNALQDIDNAIVDLQNSGDLSMVEQVLANNQAALDAYVNNLDKQIANNQWTQQFNANREDTMAEQAYRDKVYADQMAQQTLENQWYEQSYNDAQKKEETNRIITLLENGMYNPETASALLGVPTSQLENFVNYINRARNLELNNTQSLISNRNNSSSGGGSPMQNTNSTPYKSTDTSIANYINGQLGTNVIEYDSNNKKYGLAYSLENGENTLNNQQVYSWYKDPIIQKVLIGVNNGDISPNEGQQFLLNLGYSNTDIERVKGYTFEKKEGE